MHFHYLNDVDFKKKNHRVFIKSITGDNSQLVIVKLEPGDRKEHDHAEEQIGYILSGSLSVTIGREKKILRPGDGYYIPPFVSHRLETVSETSAEYIEISSPPKEENRM